MREGFKAPDSSMRLSFPTFSLIHTSFLKTTTSDGTYVSSLAQKLDKCPSISSVVVNKSKMLSAGVADVVLKFLQSEMPPVQFKLLGTLRMLIDTQGICLFTANP